MLEQCLFLAGLIAAILFVLRTKPPFSVYFHAQLVFTIVVWASLLLGVSVYSLAYKIIFILCTSLILLGAWWGVHEYLLDHAYRVRIWILGLFFASFLSIMSWSGMQKPMQAYNWIAIWEGFCLITLGFALSHAITLHDGNKRLIGLLLSVLWFLQALFEFGFTLHMPSPEWDRLNDYLPAMMVIGTFLAIGTLLRIKESESSNRTTGQPQSTRQLRHLPWQ